MPRPSPHALAALPALALVLSALTLPPRTQDVILLEPGTPQVVRHPDSDLPPIFRVDVPRAATALRIWTEGANADLEICASAFVPPDEAYREYADITSGDLWVDDELWINVTDSYSLEAGEWYFWLPLSPAWGALPGTQEVAYTLHCEIVVPEREVLVLGEPRTVVLERSRGLLAAFECDLPADLVAAGVDLRAEVLSMRGDVDLVVGPRGAGRTYWEPHARTTSGLAFERAVVPAATTGRRFALQVYAFAELDPFESIEATVLVCVDGPDAPTLCPPALLPSLPSDADLAARTPLERALAATVSVVGPRGGGSGVVVSPRGHVLTNAHVVSGAESAHIAPGPIARLAVAFDLGTGEPTVPTLGARLLEYDEDKDLALIAIETDLLGRPLPEGTRFPSFDLALQSPPPRIGEPVWCIGYPMTGGSHSYTTVSATTGIFAGIAPEPAGPEYKVDAAVHSGMSGGACIDATGRLVGLPSSSVSDANEGGSLGFVIPLERVPAAWWSHLE